MKSEKLILEQRANIFAQIEDKWKAVKAEKRNPTEDELAFFDKADADFNALTKELEEVRKVANMESRVEQFRSILSEGAPEPTPAKPEARAVTSEKQKAEIRKALDTWMRYGEAGLSPEQRSVLAKIESRGTDTLIGTTAALGGYTVPEEWANELYKTMLYYGGALEACGIAYKSSQGGDLHLPVVTDTSNKGAIIGQGVADVVLDTAFSEVIMKSWTYTSKIIKASMELLEDSAYDLQAEILGMGGERLGRILNEHFTLGDNSSKPQGLVPGSTLGKTAAAVAAVTRAEIVDLIHSVNRSYRNGPKVGFMFNDSTLAAIKKLSIGSADDRPLWQPSIREGEPDRLEGHKYWINNDMASLATGQKTILFGNFDKYKIRQVGGYKIARTTERYFEERALGYFVAGRFDGRYIDTAAVKHLIQA